MDCESALFCDPMRLLKVVLFSSSLLKRYNASKGSFFAFPCVSILIAVAYKKVST